MSEAVIRQSLEAALVAAVAPVRVAFENVDFAPVAGVAYVESALLPARTDNPTMGDGFKRCPGIFQATVVAPAGAGVGPAASLANLIVAAFFRGRTLHAADGVRVLVDASPTVGPGIPDRPWYRVPVSIYYTADVHAV